MGTSIDLKPLSDQAIQELGLSGHDLWLVKIDSVVYGPYETESLRHYVKDNESLFDEALVLLSDEKEWKPFWEYTKFQRRKPQGLVVTDYQGPFWIMDRGQVTGPFSYNEIDKKIEMDLLSMTDRLSVDEGVTWIKIFEVEGFDRRTHDPEELPRAPINLNDSETRLSLVPEKNQINLDDIVDLVWKEQQKGKVIQFKKEEITFQQEQPLMISPKLKWFVQSTAAILIVVATIIYNFTSTPNEQIASFNEEEEVETPKKKARTPGSSYSASIPSPSYRAPASSNYSKPASSSTSRSKPVYETKKIMHEDPVEHDEYGHTDLVSENENENDRENVTQSEEHSLVDNNRRNEDKSVDAAMNDVPQDGVPLVEEASDF